MGYIVAPEVYPGRNVLVFKQFFHTGRVFLHRMFPGTSSTAEDDVSVSVHFHIWMVIWHAVDVIYRGVCVDEVIHVVREEESCIICSGKSNASGEDVWSS